LCPKWLVGDWDVALPLFHTARESDATTINRKVGDFILASIANLCY
jgi:hypothetical protein